MTTVRYAICWPMLMMVASGPVVAFLSASMDAPIFAFTAAFASLAALPLAAQAPGKRMDVFRPYLGTAVLLYLYSLSTLLFVRETGLTYYGESVADADLRTYEVACLLAIAGLAIGTAAAARWRSRHVPRFDGTHEQTKWFLQAAGLLGLLALPFIGEKFTPWTATSYAETALSLRVDHLADQAAGLREIMLETIPITLVICAATILVFDRRHAVVMRAFAGIVLMGYTITTLLSGWRGQLMIALLIVTIYFHYRIRAIHAWEIMLGGAAVYLLVNVLSIARASANPVEMFEFLLAEIGEHGFKFMALQQSGELATSTNLLRLIQGIRSGETQFGWGSIGLGQFAAFIPRAVFPDRPEIASELFVKVFYPGIFESGGGYGFFMPQDGYWDFGLPGVFSYCAAFAFLVERGYGWLRIRFASSFFLFLYALLYSQLVLSVVRSGLFASLKAALISALPIILILGWIPLVRRLSARGSLPS